MMINKLHAKVRVNKVAKDNTKYLIKFRSSDNKVDIHLKVN